MARFMSSRPSPLSAHGRRRHDSPDDRLVAPHTRREQPRAGDDRGAIVDGKEVQRARVEPVGIGVGARLLDDEDPLPQLHDRVELEPTVRASNGRSSQRMPHRSRIARP